VSIGTTYFIFLNAQHAVHILLTACSICCFQDRVLSIINPRNLISDHYIFLIRLNLCIDIIVILSYELYILSFIKVQGKQTDVEPGINILEHVISIYVEVLSI